MPGAVETFVEDYSSPERLEPEWMRLEDLLIRSCQEHSSHIYIILGNLEYIQDKYRSKILGTIRRLWNNKRCKLFLSMSREFYQAEIAGTLPEPKTNVFELKPNAKDIERYVLSRLTEGPHFMQSNKIQVKTVETLIEK